MFFIFKWHVTDRTIDTAKLVLEKSCCQYISIKLKYCKYIFSYVLPLIIIRQKYLAKCFGVDVDSAPLSQLPWSCGVLVCYLNVTYLHVSIWFPKKYLGLSSKIHCNVSNAKDSGKVVTNMLSFIRLVTLPRLSTLQLPLSLMHDGIFPRAVRFLIWSQLL